MTIQKTNEIKITGFPIIITPLAGFGFVGKTGFFYNNNTPSGVLICWEN